MGVTVNLRPLGDRLIVKDITNEDVTTEGGIILTAAAVSEDTAVRGKVIRVSFAVEQNEVESERIIPDNEVAYSQFAGTPFMHDGVKYRLLRITDLLAVIE